MGFSFQKNILAALKGLVIAAVGVAGTAVLTYFSIPENIAPILGVLPESIQTALVPIIAGLFAQAANWLKNRNK